MHIWCKNTFIKLWKLSTLFTRTAKMYLVSCGTWWAVMARWALVEQKNPIYKKLTMHSDHFIEKLAFIKFSQLLHFLQSCNVVKELLKPHMNNTKRERCRFPHLGSRCSCSSSCPSASGCPLWRKWHSHIPITQYTAWPCSMLFSE